MNTFIDNFRDKEKQIISNIIFAKFDFVFRKSAGDDLKRIVSTLISFVLILAYLLLGFLIIRRSLLSLLFPSIILAATSALALFVMSWCYRYYLDQFENFRKDHPFGPELDKRLSKWLDGITSIRNQVLVSLLLAVLVVSFIYGVYRTVGLPFPIDNGTFIILILPIFCITQGGYWAFVSPWLTYELKRSDLSEVRVYQLCPGRTQVFIVISRVLSIFSAWVAIINTFCVISLLSLQPDFASGGIYHLAVLVLSGYVVSLYTFLFPQINLAQVIQHAKTNTLLELQSHINSLYQKGEFGRTKIEHLRGLMELYETVNKTPNTAISFLSLQSLASSIVLPTITAILGLLDWRSILADFF